MDYLGRVSKGSGLLVKLNGREGVSVASGDDGVLAVFASLV